MRTHTHTAHHQNRGQVIYFSSQMKGTPVLMEVCINGPACTLLSKASDAGLAQAALGAIKLLLSS